MDLLRDVWAVGAEQPALAYGGETVGYGELRRRVCALVQEMERRGLGAGARVALHLPHGPWGPVALLAAWHAGAVAVPIDLHHPLERIRTILARADAELLIADGRRGEALVRRLGEPWATRALLSRAPDRWTGGRLESLEADQGWREPPRHADDDAASILFTSGSTGEPKGVTLSRRNVDVFAGFWRRELGLGPGDRVAHAADLAFDLSLLEVPAALAGGATVVPVPEATLRFAGELAAWVAREQITVWYSVPASLVGMARAGLAASEPPHRLRAVLYAGERMAIDDARAVRACLPRARFLNLFGPTETNVSCFHELPATLAGDEIPIGRPCPYLDLRVVDGGGREADEGELVARGGTVMAGYWAEPRREQWIELDGRRYLCTGDRVRRDADGVLWFRGRMDRMVKVRGYRVEPEEAERALAANPQVGEVAVVVTPGPDGEGIALLAAVTAAQRDAAPDPGELTERLDQLLPGYAVPARIEVLERLPRTPRGKVDRDALVTRLSAALTAPRSAR